jgi:hypothetical protein
MSKIPSINKNMSVAAKAPEAFYKIDKWSPEILMPPQDILCTSYTAVTKNSSTIRFVVRSSGPRALLKSSIVCEIPVNFVLRDLQAGGTGMNTTYGQVGAVEVAGYICGRWGGFERACSSIQLSLNNGVQISLRPDQFTRICEEWFYTEADDRSCVEGPRDEAPYGRKMGRGVTAHRDLPNAWQMARDKGTARRQEIALRSTRGGGTTGTFNHTFHFEVPIGPFLKYARTPEDCGARTKESWLPYISQFSLTLNMKPQGEAVCNMLQAQQGLAAGEVDGKTVANADGLAVSGILGAVARDRQVPGPHSTYSVGADCKVHCQWCSPGDDVVLGPSYSFPAPRFLQYQEEATISDDEKDQSTEFRFDAIKVEALPTFIVFDCGPKFSDDLVAGDFPRCKFNSCGYQDTLNPIAQSASRYDENGQALTATINERSSIMSSYSVYELYRMTKKNMQGRMKLDFEEWCLGDKQIVVLRPCDLLQVENVYAPQTVSFRIKYGKNRQHKGNPGVKANIQQCRMTFVYTDVITLAPGAASLSSFLVNKSQLKRSGMEQSESKLEDLRLE